MLESIINEEFIINEKVDKMAEKEPDQFGYGAIHYIVTLGERFSGTRYDELKKFLCEIQVRTVLQDAWANIEHHLVYKQESAVPKDLQRKLNGLSGLFETADNQFQQIRDEQNDYIRKVRDSQRKIDKFLAHDIDLDTLREFLLWKFSNIPVESFDDQLGIMIKYFKKVNYNILRDIDQKIPEDVITKAIKATAEMDLTLVDGKVPSCVILLIALVMVDSSLYESIPLTTNMQEVLAKYA